MQAELSRLQGQAYRLVPGGYEITDIAGEGPAMVGCIENTSEGLVFASGDKRLRLQGPLAVPRIAGPRYKVWVLGRVEGPSLYATRLGILAAPPACP